MFPPIREGFSSLLASTSSTIRGMIARVKQLVKVEVVNN